MRIIKLTLLIPVSVNGLYANSKKGRYKTKRAKLWEMKALDAIMPELQKHRALCDANVLERWKFKQGRKTIDLRGLAKAHPNLFYFPIYKFSFHRECYITPTDISNFIKHLEDFLVDVGFFLDDMFIVSFLPVRLPSDAKNPRVDIQIATMDKIKDAEFYKRLCDMELHNVLETF